jgi:hypothetical protein
MNRLLTASPIAAAFLVIAGSTALAQGAFPAPLPGQASEPPGNSNPPAATPATPPKDFPSNGAPPVGTFGGSPKPGAPNACAKDFAALREDVETKSKSIKAASDRRAPPQEACRLIGDYRVAETKLFKYVEMNVARCAIPASSVQEMKADLQRTQDIQTKVCSVAQQMLKPGGRESLKPGGREMQEPTIGPGDFWPTSPKPRI